MNHEKIQAVRKRDDIHYVLELIIQSFSIPNIEHTDSEIPFLSRTDVNSFVTLVLNFDIVSPINKRVISVGS